MIYLFWLIEVIALFSAFCRASFLLKEPSQLICFSINDPPGNFYRKTMDCYVWQSGINNLPLFVVI